MYKQIKPKKLYEEVAQSILELIESEQLKPGDRLESVQQLAVNFQVGRSAIREALTALKAMGYIEMKQGEGTFVKENLNRQNILFPFSPLMIVKHEDVKNLLEVRKILEVGCVGIAATKHTELQMYDILQALEKMPSNSDNEADGEQADWEFHKAIAVASGNKILLKVMNQISSLMMDSMRETRRLWLYSQKTTLEQLYHEHAKIAAAISSRDSELAKQAMMEHLDNVGDIIDMYYMSTNA